MARPVGSLSGGQRRRIEIARALIHRPIWLFLDEPSTGLDIDNRLKLSNILHSLVTNEGCGVLWCTHIPDELRSGDHLIMMNEGEKIFDGHFDSRTGHESISVAGRKSMKRNQFTPVVAIFHREFDRFVKQKTRCVSDCTATNLARGIRSRLSQCSGDRDTTAL